MAGWIRSRLESAGIIPAEGRRGDETEWDHVVNPGMLFHLPSSRFPFVKLVVVKEYEQGVFLRDGKLYAVVPPGRWFLSRMPVVGRMEFIWVDTGIKKVKFGLRTLTSDGVELGSNGVVYLRVTDAERFVLNLVTARELFQPSDLELFLREQIASVMRAEMANYDVQSLYLERDMFISVARVKLQEMFGDLGLEFRTLEVPGFLLPDDVTEALRKPMMAQREAQAMIQTGSATAEILGKMKDAGVDPVQYKAAEALMKYAGRPPGEGGGVIGGDLLMPLVFYGILMKDQGIPGDIKDGLKQLFPRYSQQAQMGQQEEPEADEEKAEIKTEYSAEEIQGVLDGLDVRLAKGEISEATYNRLKEKWEARL